MRAAGSGDGSSPRTTGRPRRGGRHGARSGPGRSSAVTAALAVPEPDRAREAEPRRTPPVRGHRAQQPLVPERQHAEQPLAAASSFARTSAIAYSPGLVALGAPSGVCRHNASASCIARCGCPSAKRDMSAVDTTDVTAGALEPVMRRSRSPRPRAVGSPRCRPGRRTAGPDRRTASASSRAASRRTRG